MAVKILRAYAEIVVDIDGARRLANAVWDPRLTGEIGAAAVAAEYPVVPLKIPFDKLNYVLQDKMDALDAGLGQGDEAC